METKDGNGIRAQAVARDAETRGGAPAAPALSGDAAVPPAGPEPVALTGAGGPLQGRRVLVVEDDREIGQLVAAYLGRAGAEPVLVASAEEAFAACAARAPSLVLLDLGLPGADGLEFLRGFRRGSLAPVIIVSARESDEDKILGLGLGADDFVSKPFSPRVLVARAAALLRRSAYAGGEGAGRLAFGRFTLDRDARILERAGRRVPLAPREYALLEFLCRNPGRTFSAEELHRAVWELEHGDRSTVAVHVQRLRRKIEDDPAAPRLIETVPGSGYRLVPDGGRGGGPQSPDDAGGGP